MSRSVYALLLCCLRRIGRLRGPPRETGCTRSVRAGESRHIQIQRCDRSGSVQARGQGLSQGRAAIRRDRRLQFHGQHRLPRGDRERSAAGEIQDRAERYRPLLLNTTVGIGGLFDPASKAGLDKNDEDFGQTLGKWGMLARPLHHVAIFRTFEPERRRRRGRRSLHGAGTTSSGTRDRYGAPGARRIDTRARLLELR